MENETEVAEQELPVEHQEEVKEVVKHQRVEQPRNEKDLNWERARAVLEAQSLEIQALKAQHQQKLKSAEEEEENEFSKLDKKEVITIEQAEKLVEKRARKEAEKLLADFEQRNKTNEQARLLAQSEQTMREKHEDYDYIVENFALPLITNDEALAYQVRNSTNPAATAYKLGKLSDSYEEQNMPKATHPKAEKILKNSSRPTSANAIGVPLKGQADAASKMSSKDIWEQSQKYAKGF